MRFNATIASLVLALLAGCGGANGDLHPARLVTMDAVYGSSLQGVRLSQSGEAVSIDYTSLPAEGRMLRLNLPAGTALAGETWTDADSTLHLLASTKQGAELGIVPAEGYAGEAVRVDLRLVHEARSPSLAPIGPANVVTDLSVTAAGPDQVELQWTQRNVGDYDFNGEVNIADLTPLAPRLELALDRSEPYADQQTAYWVDGDANGLINIADITPIGAHYSSQIIGYKVTRNGVDIPGQASGDPTVRSTSAQKRAGLPNRYSLTLDGAVADTWVVAPVDSLGNEGADSSGNPGAAPADINTNISISGLELRDLATGQPGEFGPGKCSSRVIDPGIVVDRIPIGNATYSGTNSSISNLPRNKVLMLDFMFAPTVNLLTGAPKGGSSLKGTSAVPQEDIVQASVIFELPEGDEPAEIVSAIVASPNPDGGYLLTMTTDLTIPGDNPETPVVEPSFSQTQVTQIDWANGTVARDTDGNGIFDDNPHVGDTDRDGVGDNERERFGEFDDREDRSEAEEIGIVGTVKTIDIVAGTITLTGIANNGEHENLFEGPFDEFTFEFTEVSEFLIRTDENNDGEFVGPTEFSVGDTVEVDMYPALNSKFWVEKVKRDDRTHGGGGHGGDD